MSVEITDLYDPADLTLFARELLLGAAEDRESNRFLLSRWMPPVFVEQIEFEWSARTTRDFTDAIPFRTWSTESDFGARPGRVKKRGEMAPISRKMMLTELDKIRAREANRAGGAAAQAVDEMIESDAELLVRGLLARMEIAAADSIFTGTLAMAGTADPENGLHEELSVDWGREASRSDTVGTGWSADPVNATPFDDEEALLDVLEDEEELSPETDLVAVMNEGTWRAWGATTAVRNSFNTVRVMDRIADSDLQAIRRDHGLPPAVVYKASARNVDGTKRKLAPDGLIAYLPRDAAVGATMYGLSAYADEPEISLDSDERPGPVLFTSRQVDPLRSFTHLDAVGLPVLGDPNASAVLDTEP